MATIEELAAKVAELEQQMAAITAPPTEYYTSAYSGEEIDAAVKKVSEGLAGGVTSFNGRTGAVKPQAGDYNATQIPVSGEPEAETVAAALSNKAPGGYGLGGNATMTEGPDYNLDSISGSGWFVGAPKMDNFTFGSCLVENIQWSVGEGAQIAFLYPGTSSPAVYNTLIQRTKFGGVFGPWEWVNPPMQLGVEYRTAERYNGKPVYMKLVDCGAGPNNTRKTVSANTQNVETSISCTGNLGNGTIPYEWFAGDASGAQAITCTFNGQAINIAATADYSSLTVFVILKYTKTTD